MMIISSLTIVLVFGAISFSQAQREAFVLSDTIYFLDGSKSFPTSKWQRWEDRELWPIKFLNVILVQKSDKFM